VQLLDRTKPGKGDVVITKDVKVCFLCPHVSSVEMQVARNSSYCSSTAAVAPSRSPSIPRDLSSSPSAATSKEDWRLWLEHSFESLVLL